MKTFILALSLIAFTGCATADREIASQRLHGDKEEAVVDCSDQVLLSQGKILDRSGDLQRSVVSIGIGGIYIPTVFLPRFAKCVEAKGYKFRREPEVDFRGAALEELSYGSYLNFLVVLGSHTR